MADFYIKETGQIVPFAHFMNVMVYTGYYVIPLTEWNLSYSFLEVKKCEKFIDEVLSEA